MKRFKLSRYRLDKKLNLKASKTGQLCKSKDVATLEDMLNGERELSKKIRANFNAQSDMNRKMKQQLEVTMEQLKEQRSLVSRMIELVESGETNRKMLRRAKRIVREPWWKRVWG